MRFIEAAKALTEESIQLICSEIMRLRGLFNPLTPHKWRVGGIERVFSARFVCTKTRMLNGPKVKGKKTPVTNKLLQLQKKAKQKAKIQLQLASKSNYLHFILSSYF